MTNSNEMASVMTIVLVAVFLGSCFELHAQEQSETELIVTKLEQLGNVNIRVIDDELSYVNLTQSRFDDTHCALLANKKNLVYLSLSETKITDVSLKTIGELDGLKWLFLDGTDISDKGCKDLQKLSRLRVLSLVGTSITDSVFESKDELWPHLHTLDISNCQVTDTSMDAILKLAKLTDLKMRGTKITNDGLRKIVAIKSLSALDVAETKISNDGFLALAKLENLRSIHIENTNISGKAVAEFCRQLPECKVFRFPERHLE